jgi:hypothetical protein
MTELPLWLVFGLGVTAGAALGVVGCLVVVLVEDAARWGEGRRR